MTPGGQELHVAAFQQDTPASADTEEGFLLRTVGTRCPSDNGKPHALPRSVGPVEPER